MALVALALLPLPLPAASQFLSLGIGWSAQLDSEVLDLPVIDSQRVYLALRSGRVVALALADGQQQWAIELPTARGPAVDGDRVFAATATELVALDARSGRAAWRVPVEAILAVPSARAGWVIVGAGTELLAFRADDGRLIWRSTLPSGVGSAATIDGERVYAPLADGSVVSINVVNGTIAWRAELPAPCATITAVGDRLFVGCKDNFFYSLEADSGVQRWRWRTGADVVAPAAYDGDRVYFASLDNLVRALDFGSGVQQWRHPMDTRPLSGPVLDEDLLIVPASSQLRAVRVKDGALAGAFTAPAELATPAVFAATDSTSTIRVVIVTGAPGGGWRVYGLAPAPEPVPAPLTEIPGRPMSPDAPPSPPGAPPPAASHPL
jgi:outer membrane protein assembly factor BamB